MLILLIHYIFTYIHTYVNVIISILWSNSDSSAWSTSSAFKVGIPVAPAYEVNALVARYLVYH